MFSVFELFDRILKCDAFVVTESRARVCRPQTSLSPQ